MNRFNYLCLCFSCLLFFAYVHFYSFLLVFDFLLLLQKDLSRICSTIFTSIWTPEQKICTLISWVERLTNTTTHIIEQSTIQLRTYIEYGNFKLVIIWKYENKKIFFQRATLQIGWGKSLWSRTLKKKMYHEHKDESMFP